MILRTTKSKRETRKKIHILVITKCHKRQIRIVKTNIITSINVMTYNKKKIDKNTLTHSEINGSLPDSSPFWPAAWISFTKSVSLHSSESVKTSSYNFNPFTTFTCQYQSAL